MRPRDRFRDWVARYEDAWRTAGTATLHELFTEDATYSTAPFATPFVGLDQIAQLWDDEHDGPDEVFSMTSEVVAAEEDRGVVRVEVHYGQPLRQVYRDLWIITLAEDGRCRAFEEWPFWPEGTAGSFSPGPDTDQRA